MICTDPNLKGIVPADVDTFGGRTYHCTHEQHKDLINAGSADESSTLAVAAGIIAALISSYFSVWKHKYIFFLMQF